MGTALIHQVRVAPAGAFCTVKVARSPPDNVAREAFSVTGVWQNARADNERHRTNGAALRSIAVLPKDRTQTVSGIPGRRRNIYWR